MSTQRVCACVCESVRTTVVLSSGIPTTSSDKRRRRTRSAVKVLSAHPGAPKFGASSARSGVCAYLCRRRCVCVQCAETGENVAAHDASTVYYRQRRVHDLPASRNSCSRSRRSANICIPTHKHTHTHPGAQVLPGRAACLRLRRRRRRRRCRALLSPAPRMRTQTKPARILHKTTTPTTTTTTRKTTPPPRTTRHLAAAAAAASEKNFGARRAFRKPRKLLFADDQ